MTTTHLKIDSPVGPLTLIAADGALTGVHFSSSAAELSDVGRQAPEDPVLRETARQLGEYFEGSRRRFDLPLHLEGTEFQCSVWWALAEIPHGSTTTYGEMARGLGRPGASRAVGAANGKNPISIILPCHRVIGGGGALVGFGGGLPAKAWLLEHESRGQGEQLRLPTVS